jgi:hypothetical protein
MHGVAREVNPIVDHAPVATDGGHWMTDDGREVYIEELAGVYRADFDARAAIAKAKRAIEACRGIPFTVISLRGRTYAFNLLQVNADSPDIVLWSYKGDDWACDHATCSPVNGYDALSLARDALKRIDTLANTTA